MSGFELAPRAAPVLIHLLRGVIYRDQHEDLWQTLLALQAVARDYFRVIGLDLFVDEGEGYAFLRQREPDPAEAEPLPRLVARRPLSHGLTLLCVLLRRRLVELDAGGGDTRLVLGREQMVEMLRVFLPASGSEARMVERIHRHINRLVEYGFLRPLKGEGERYEVRRILTALVDAQWLTELEARLAASSGDAQAAQD
jgi:hypothetical protein